MTIFSLETLLWLLSGACFATAIGMQILSWRSAWQPFAIEEKATLSINKAQEIETRVFELDRQITREREQEKEEKPVFRKEFPEIKISPEELREKNDKKVVDILCQHHVITREILDKALEHQKKNGGTQVQFLLQYGYVNEKQLAQCVSAQFKVPYLPLDAYQISDDIVKSIPVDIAEKYWVMPVDKQGDSLMVVMINPLDTKAIKELEEITGLEIIPFVGVISEISSALRNYYQIFVKDQGARTPKVPIYFIDTKAYAGAERRHSIRYNSRINVSFPVEGRYKKSQTVNVSRDGFAFLSDEPLALGTVVTLEVNLPQGFSPLPISAVTQVLRCVSREKNNFEIGVKILKISKQEVGIIISYASRHIEE